MENFSTDCMSHLRRQKIAYRIKSNLTSVSRVKARACIHACDVEIAAGNQTNSTGRKSRVALRVRTGLINDLRGNGKQISDGGSESKLLPPHRSGPGNRRRGRGRERIRSST